MKRTCGIAGRRCIFPSESGRFSIGKNTDSQRGVSIVSAAKSLDVFIANQGMVGGMTFNFSLLKLRHKIKMRGLYGYWRFDADMVNFP